MQKEEMIPIDQCCTHYKIEMTFVQSLQEAGLLNIIVMEEKYYLSQEELGNLEKFIRLHHELEINTEGIEAINYMLERMEALQLEIKSLKNRLGIYE